MCLEAKRVCVQAGCVCGGYAVNTNYYIHIIKGKDCVHVNMFPMHRAEIARADVCSGLFPCRTAAPLPLFSASTD